MSDVTKDPMWQHRANRMREYLRDGPAKNEQHKQAWLSKRIGISDSRVAQIMEEGFGETAGVRYAQKLRLKDQRWFDRDPGTPIDYDPTAAECSSASTVAVAAVETIRSDPALSFPPRAYTREIRGAVEGLERRELGVVTAQLLDIIGNESEPERVIERLRDVLDLARVIRKPRERHGRPARIYDLARERDVRRLARRSGDLPGENKGPQCDS